MYYLKNLNRKMFRTGKIDYLSLYLCKALLNHYILLSKGAEPRLVYHVMEVYLQLCLHEALLKHYMLMAKGGELNLFCN